MKHPSQEDLLGYVLGALDAQEQRDVQRFIDADPELEEVLLEIRSSLAPLDCLDGAKGPRPGLARRTSEMVANVQKQLEQEKQSTARACPITDQLIADATSVQAAEDQTIPLPDAAQPSAKVMLSDSSMLERSIRPSSWSLSDMLVGVAAMAVVAAILLPAVSYSRFNSRMIACQNNLRGLGSALMTFSSMNPSGEFPRIPDCVNLGVSGSYAPILKEAGLINDDTNFLCPELGASFDDVFHVPTCEQVKNASGCQLEHFKRVMGGHYGYSLGYMECDEYRCPSNKGRSHIVLLADMPSKNREEGWRSANHGGHGQNCLFEDGSIKFVTGYAYGEDPIFYNDEGIIAPGTDSEDSVIAPSHIAPKVSRPYSTSFK